jgi:hypothetical protein
VLLPSDLHRKPVTSITAVLLQFVTYLLTLSHSTIIRALLVVFNAPACDYHVISINNFLEKIHILHLGPYACRITFVYMSRTYFI